MHTKKKARRIDRPTFREQEPFRLVETMPTERDNATFIRTIHGVTNTYLRTYQLGDCPVVVTREGGRWHLSISHPRRYPTWDEVAAARYRLLPKSGMFAMPLPPEEQYINLHQFCFHVYEFDADSLGEKRED